MINDILWLFVEAATSMFEIILVFTFFNGFLPSKDIKMSKKIIVFTVAVFRQFVVSTYFYEVPGALVFNICMLTFLVAVILYSGKLTYKLFSSILLVAVLVIVELFSVLILVYVMDIEMPRVQNEPFLKLIAAMIKNVLTYFVIKIICSFRKSSIHEKGKIYITFLMIVPLICAAITIVILDLVLSGGNENNVISALMASLGLMYVNVIIFSIFEGLLRELDKQYKYRLVEKQLELQLNHYNKLAESRAVLSETIHDFKNHINCIYNLYKYNKGDELGKYIEALTKVAEEQSVIDTGNPVIDALLNDKLIIANRLGIEFERELNLPQNLRVAPEDICAILGNSLDNAIEAIKRINNKAIRRQMALSMVYRDSYLIIVVNNTIDMIPLREGKFFRSSKSSPELHGIGMHSIERTVKKYDGNMVVKCDQGIFKLEIVLSVA